MDVTSNFYMKNRICLDTACLTDFKEKQKICSLSHCCTAVITNAVRLSYVVHEDIAVYFVTWLKNNPILI